MKFIIVTLLAFSLSACSTGYSQLTQSELSKLEEAIPVEVWEPRYPRQAAIDGVEGYVVFVFDVSSDGRINNVRKVKSVPEDVFDDAALHALKKWKFKPALDNGVPVMQKDMIYTLEFRFAE